MEQSNILPLVGLLVRKRESRPSVLTQYLPYAENMGVSLCAFAVKDIDWQSCCVCGLMHPDKTETLLPFPAIVYNRLYCKSSKIAKK